MLSYKRKASELYNLYDDCEIGSAKIERFIVTKEECDRIKTMSMIGGSNYYFYYDFSPGKYVRLKLFGCLAMSNTPMEVRTNYKFVSEAFGDVLIGGLGIGMLPYVLQDKESIKKITVIEKNKDVIKLVNKFIKFNDKVEIVNDDVFTEVIAKNKKYDSIYMDIWSDVCNDNWEEYKKLSRKYCRKLTKDENSFQTAWLKQYLSKEIRKY